MGPEEDCAAPGHASVSGGEAVSLYSPALRPGPARPEDRLQTQTAPPHSPLPAHKDKTFTLLRQHCLSKVSHEVSIKFAVPRLVKEGHPQSERGSAESAAGS